MFIAGWTVTLRIVSVSELLVPSLCRADSLLTPCPECGLSQNILCCLTRLHLWLLLTSEYERAYNSECSNIGSSLVVQIQPWCPNLQSFRLSTATLSKRGQFFPIWIGTNLQDRQVRVARNFCYVMWKLHLSYERLDIITATCCLRDVDILTRWSPVTM